MTERNAHRQGFELQYALIRGVNGVPPNKELDIETDHMQMHWMNYDNCRDYRANWLNKVGSGVAVDGDCDLHRSLLVELKTGCTCCY